MEYSNADELRALGIDPTPQDGDWVAWVDSGIGWTVYAEDDFEGPTALIFWPEGEKAWSKYVMLQGRDGKWV